jgi:hypothetical protein
MRFHVELYHLAVLLPLYLAIFVFRNAISAWFRKATGPSLETWNEIESGEPLSPKRLTRLYWVALMVASTMLGFAIADALFKSEKPKYISLDEYRRRWPGT